MHTLFDVSFKIIKYSHDASPRVLWIDLSFVLYLREATWKYIMANVRYYTLLNKKFSDNVNIYSYVLYAISSLKSTRTLHKSVIRYS